MSFKKINIDLTKWLTTIEQLTTEEIQQLLQSKLHDPVLEIYHSLSQGTFLNIELSRVFQELLLTHTVNSSSEFKTYLLINAGEILKNTFENNLVNCSWFISSAYKNFRYRLTDGYPGKLSLFESSSDELSYLVLSAQASSVQTEICKMLVTKHLSLHTCYPTLSSALQEC